MSHNLISFVRKDILVFAMSSVVREKLESYFATLNATSSRMMADIISSRQQYNDVWDNLPPEEQSDILWQAIVKPEAEEKYKNLAVKSVDVDYFPVLRTRPGEKIIVDEDTSTGRQFGCSWRDEHSAPFRWETQSQLELRIHERDMSDNDKIKTLQREAAKELESVKEPKKEEEIKRPAPVKRPEVPPPPVPPHATPPVPPRTELPPVPPHVEKTDIPIYAKVVKRKSSAKTLVISEMKAHQKAKEEMKPAVPPRMSLELKGDIDLTKFRAHTINIDGIPKTGFDFLDNW